jgi:hypothetical protein
MVPPVVAQRTVLDVPGGRRRALVTIAPERVEWTAPVERIDPTGLGRDHLVRPDRDAYEIVVACVPRPLVVGCFG